MAELILTCGRQNTWRKICPCAIFSTMHSTSIGLVLNLGPPRWKIINGPSHLYNDMLYKKNQSNKLINYLTIFFSPLRKSPPPPPSGPGPRYYRSFTITCRHTTFGRTSDQPDTQTSTWQYTVGRTPLYQWSARHTALYLTIHSR